MARKALRRVSLKLPPVGKKQKSEAKTQFPLYVERITRMKDILYAKEHGKTYKQIAGELGISRQRVHKILNSPVPKK